MSDFTPAFLYLMGWEDPTHQYASVPDVGGFAISGINSAAWPIDYAAILQIPQDQRGPAVANFYQSKFWNPLEIGQINSQDLANRVFDEAVNTGPTWAIILLQRAVNSLSVNAVGVDGEIGPKTFGAVNAADPDWLLAAYRQQRLSYYDDIVAAHPGDSQYLSVWTKRAEA